MNYKDFDNLLIEGEKKILENSSSHLLVIGLVNYGLPQMTILQYNIQMFTGIHAALLYRDWD